MTDWKTGHFPPGYLRQTHNGVVSWTPARCANELRKLARAGGFWRESDDRDNLNLTLRRAIRLAQEGLGSWEKPTKCEQVFAFSATSPHPTSWERRLITAAHTNWELVSREMAVLEAVGWKITAKSWE